MSRLFFTHDGERVEIMEFDSGVIRQPIPSDAFKYAEPVRVDLAQMPTPQADIPLNNQEE
jgi:hypothetical protein